MNEQSIFIAALERGPGERTQFIDQICGENGDLRKRVEILLQAHEKAGSLLNQPAAEPMITVDYDLAAECPDGRIGPYKLRERLGEGGMGVVWAAEQKQPLRRKVAIKVIKPGMDSSHVIGRFEAEREALSLMDHPNIARVLDAGTTDAGRPYFVMELIRGVSIVEYCDKQELSTRERLGILVTVCRAVQHAHAKGVIHRDLKPGNILVSPHDGIPIVKIIDFGIAKALGQQLTDKTVYTRLSQIIGTPLYMSPEQAEINALDVDIRSDVYSLGVLLYELLTGTTPFDQERFSEAAYEEIKRIIREEEPPTPSRRLSSLGDAIKSVSTQRKTEPARLVSTIKGELDWIAMRCLEKDRSRRYQTTMELAADVDRYLRNEPVAAVPPSQLYRAKKVVRRYRVPFAVAASFFLLSLVFVIFLMNSQARYKAIAQSLESELLDTAFNAAVNGELDPSLRAIQSALEVGTSEELAETLKAFAYSTAGHTDTAIRQLEDLASDPSNYLARAALVWTYYDSGRIADAETVYEQLLEHREEATRLEDSEFGGDFARVLLARLRTYAPGNAHQEAINELTDVISRHRLWGFAYYARAEAHRDKLMFTKDFVDLQAALEDDRTARWLLPDSELVKSASLTLHLHAYQYAQSFPGEVDGARVKEWRSSADELASQFASSLTHWDGAAGALAYYRATKQDDRADALEQRIEEEFAQLQTIRDFRWFETRDYQSFEDEMESASLFTKHIYALALFERGDTSDALNLIDDTLEQCRHSGDLLTSAIDVLQLMQEFDKCEELAREYIQSENSWDLWELPNEIARFHAGELSDKQLLELAYPFHSHVCYAHYSIGVSHLARGDRESAEKHFQVAVDTGRIGWGAFGRSKVFLKRLKENRNWPYE